MLVGTGLFWVCGAAMKINFQPWGLQVLRLPDNTQIALLGLWLSVGVMVAFIGYLASFFDPIQQLSQLYNTFFSSGVKEG